MGTPGFLTPLQWCFSKFVVSFCGCRNEREIFAHSLLFYAHYVREVTRLALAKLKVPMAPQ